MLHRTWLNEGSSGSLGDVLLQTSLLVIKWASHITQWLLFSFYYITFCVFVLLIGQHRCEDVMKKDPLDIPLLLILHFLISRLSLTQDCNLQIEILLHSPNFAHELIACLSFPAV